MNGLKLTALLTLITMLLIGVSDMALAQQDAPADKTYTKSALPDNGVFISHPLDKKITFYIANRRQGRDLQLNIGRPLGLYSAADGGETWKLLTSEFEFKGLFIHPDTGKLFAIAEYCWPPGDENKGLRQPCIADKVLLSGDGQDWTDISGKEKRFTEIYGIFPDPDNYGRICLHNATATRPYVLQATDDNYTEWNWYRAGDWLHRHNMR